MPLSAANVPTDRTFIRKLDPAGEIDYTVDYTTYLGTTTISSFTKTLDSAAVALGVEWISESNTTTAITVRIGVQTADHEDTAWDNDGTDISFKLNVVDSDGQIHELSYAVTIVQQ
jgi:hypothetical protein